MSYLQYGLIAIALIVLVLAFVMPDHQENPDRLFGLTLPKSKGRTGVRFARIVAAALALSRKREESMFAFSRRNLEDPAFAVEPAKVVHGDGPLSGGSAPAPVSASSAETKKTRNRRLRNPRIVDDLPADLDVAEGAAAHAEPLVAALRDQSGEAAAIEPEPAGYRAELPVGTEPALVLSKAAGYVASSEDPDEASTDDEQIAEPPIGREGRRIMWPRLIGLDSSTLSGTERLGVVLTLGAIAEPYVAPIMAEVLNQENDVAIRDAALEAIRDAQLDDALHAVEECLTEPRDRERILAVEALARLGGGAEPLLFAALSDECVAVVMAAGNALRRREAITVEDLRSEVAQNSDEQQAERVIEMIAVLAGD